MATSRISTKSAVSSSALGPSGTVIHLVVTLEEEESEKGEKAKEDDDEEEEE